MLDKRVDWQADILCDFAKQDGRQVTAAMNWNGGCAAVRMAEMLVRASLPDFREA